MAEDEYSTSLAATVRAVITDVVGPAALEGVDDDAPLFEGMVLDSLHLVAIVSELEQRFGITISPEDLVPDNFGSLNKIAHFVEARR